MSKKIRVAAAGMLAAAGVSLGVALLAPATASADPWNPWITGPNHPILHYAGDLQHPVWATTHPVRALTP